MELSCLLLRTGLQRLAKPLGLLRDLDRVVRVQRKDAQVVSEINREVRLAVRQREQAVEELGPRVRLQLPGLFRRELRSHLMVANDNDDRDQVPLARSGQLVPVVQPAQP